MKNDLTLFVENILALPADIRGRILGGSLDVLKAAMGLVAELNDGTIRVVPSPKGGVEYVPGDYGECVPVRTEDVGCSPAAVSEPEPEEEPGPGGEPAPEPEPAPAEKAPGRILPYASDASRDTGLSVVHYLRERGPATVRDIATMLHMSLANTRRHLHILEEAGWIRMDGRAYKGGTIYAYVPPEEVRVRGPRPESVREPGQEPGEEPEPVQMSPTPSLEEVWDEMDALFAAPLKDMLLERQSRGADGATVSQIHDGLCEAVPPALRRAHGIELTDNLVYGWLNGRVAARGDCTAVCPDISAPGRLFWRLARW